MPWSTAGRCKHHHMTGCILAIDLGTGGPKVALVDHTGHTHVWRSAPVGTTFLPEGGAEQDPREMWTAIVHATHEVLDAVAHAPSIVAIAVTSQYMSTVPVAADGTPTGPCILWMDTRGAAHNLTLLTDESFMLFLERHGLIPLPSGNDNIAHAHVLQQFHPQAYADAAALVEPMDYVTARLTGRVTATQSTMFGQLVCDNRTWGTTDYDPDLVAATKLEPAKLPQLIGMNDIVGELTTAVATELGIPAGLPVIAGTIDSITSAVGSGALGPDAGSVIIGTTSVLVSHVGAMGGDLTTGVLTVPSPLEGKYYVMAENGLGGRALEWAQKLYGYPDIATALDDAQAVSADGVQFLPWLLGTIAPSPNDDVRGAYIGMSLQHDRRHALRATLEGVAQNLGWLLPAVESFVGAPFPFVRFGGGGAQSALWAQLLADCLDRPVHRLAEPRATNARGAAFLAFHALGLLDIATVPSLLHIDAVHDPDPTNRDAMARCIARLATLHPALATS